MSRVLLLIFLSLSLCITNGQEEQVFRIGNESNKKDNDKLSFDLNGGIILVEGVLNNQKQTFILDSGAPTLILNSKSRKGIKTSIQGLGGDIRGYQSTVRNFQWANIQYDSIEAVSIDLSQIERLINRKIGGLIGYELLRSVELFINYNDSTIIVNQESNFTISQDKPVISFPLSYVDHIPVLEAEIGGKKLRLGIDTGAEVNVLNKHLIQKINLSFVPKKTKSIVGVKKKEQSSVVEIDVTKLDKASYLQMNYVLMDLGEEERTEKNDEIVVSQVDGILGYPFLSSCKFSINFGQNTLNLWR